MLGRGGGWVGSASGIGLTLGRIWLYQDFAAGSGPNLTLTDNDNGSGIVFDSSYIVSSSAAVTDTDGNPIYNSATEIPANLVTVSSHAAAAVVLDGTPDVGQGSVRVWYLYSFQATDSAVGMEVAPQVVTAARTIYLDAQYLNSGLNLSDLMSASTARTNLGYSAQTAGQVLIGDGGTTFTSEAELFWDTGNNRLGIGLSAPTVDLHVYKASASPIALIDSQFTTGVPELRLSAARTTNADLATSDVAGRIGFNAQYNSTNAAIAKIDVLYTGSGTTQLGDMVFYTANAGAPDEKLRISAAGVTTITGSSVTTVNATVPIIYGSASANGTLTLRGSSNVTVGNVIISDQTGEKIVAGVQNLVTTFNPAFNFIVPESAGANNGLCVYENGESEFDAGSGTDNSDGWAILPKGPSGTPEIRVSTKSGDGVALIRAYDSGFGALRGYFSIGSEWGFQNSNAIHRPMRISGVTAQSADLTQWSNQNDFGNNISSVGPDGHFRSPVGTALLPAFAGFTDTNTGMWFPAADTLAWSLGGTEKARLDSTGLLLKDGLLIEDPGAGTFSAKIIAPTLSASYTLTLPVDDGAANEALVTDGSGVLSWAAVGTPQKSGTVALTISTTTKAITFGTARADALYTVNFTFRNTTDGTPAQRAYNVIAQSTTGFTVEWNDALDTGNYNGDWSISEHYDP